jgi:hypothetical protein
VFKENEMLTSTEYKVYGAMHALMIGGFSIVDLARFSGIGEDVVKSVLKGFPTLINLGSDSGSFRYSLHHADVEIIEQKMAEYYAKTPPAPLESFTNSIPLELILLEQYVRRFHEETGKEKEAKRAMAAMFAAEAREVGKRFCEQLMVTVEHFAAEVENPSE